MRGGYLRLQDGLPTLEDRHRLAVLVDVEVGRCQIGDRIAILSKNSIEYFLIYLAAARAGVVPIPLNYRLAPAEWSYILNDSGARLILAAGDYAREIDAIRGELMSIERFIASLP